MKGLFSILLAFNILTQSMGIHLNDLLAINEWVEHASYHQEELGDDWITFFNEHIGADKAHLQNEHQDKHADLPQNDHVCATVLPIVIVQEAVTFQKKQSLELIQVSNFYYLDDYSFLSSIDIFQPPKA